MTSQGDLGLQRPRAHDLHHFLPGPGGAGHGPGQLRAAGDGGAGGRPDGQHDGDGGGRAHGLLCGRE